MSTLITRIFSESKTYNGYVSIISNYVMKGYPIAKTLSVMGTCFYKIYWPTDLSGSLKLCVNNKNFRQFYTKSFITQSMKILNTCWRQYLL